MSILFTAIVAVLFTQDVYARRAMCEFGPMEGVEGKGLRCLDSNCVLFACTHRKIFDNHIPNVLADIKGTASFHQLAASRNLHVTVAGITGLKRGNHGFHIHSGSDCKDPGSHFNPKMVYFSFSL